MRPVQRFSREYLAQARRSSAEEVVRFLDDFRRMHEPPESSRLISLRVPESLLGAFRSRCRIEGARYQTRIKQLMSEWVSAGSRAPG